MLDSLPLPCLFRRAQGAPRQHPILFSDQPVAGYAVADLDTAQAVSYLAIMPFAVAQYSMLHHTRAFFLFATSVLLCTSVVGDARATQSEVLTPREIVMQTTDEFMTALRVSGATIRANPQLARQLADEILFPHIDFERVGRYVLGKYWRQATPEQRERFSREFRDFASNFLVSVMVEFSTAIVEYADRLSYPAMPYSPGDENTTVRVHVATNKGIKLQVDYRMHNSNGVWQIHDVRMEGISMVVMHRASFAHEIKTKGFDGLIETMAERNRRRFEPTITN